MRIRFLQHKFTSFQGELTSGYQTLCCSPELVPIIQQLGAYIGIGGELPDGHHFQEAYSCITLKGGMAVFGRVALAGRDFANRPDRLFTHQFVLSAADWQRLEYDPTRVMPWLPFDIDDSVTGAIDALEVNLPGDSPDPLALTQAVMSAGGPQSAARLLSLVMRGPSLLVDNIGFSGGQFEPAWLPLLWRLLPLREREALSFCSSWLTTRGRPVRIAIVPESLREGASADAFCGASELIASSPTNGYAAGVCFLAKSGAYTRLQRRLSWIESEHLSLDSERVIRRLQHDREPPSSPDTIIAALRELCRQQPLDHEELTENLEMAESILRNRIEPNVMMTFAQTLMDLARRLPAGAAKAALFSLLRQTYQSLMKVNPEWVWRSLLAIRQSPEQLGFVVADIESLWASYAGALAIDLLTSHRASASTIIPALPRSEQWPFFLEILTRLPKDADTLSVLDDLLLDKELTLKNHSPTALERVNERLASVESRLATLSGSSFLTTALKIRRYLLNGDETEGVCEIARQLLIPASGIADAMTLLKHPQRWSDMSESDLHGRVLGCAIERGGAAVCGPVLLNWCKLAQVDVSKRRPITAATWEQVVMLLISVRRFDLLHGLAEQSDFSLGAECLNRCLHMIGGQSPGDATMVGMLSRFIRRCPEGTILEWVRIEGPAPSALHPQVKNDLADRLRPMRRRYGEAERWLNAHGLREVEPKPPVFQSGSSISIGTTQEKRPSTPENRSAQSVQDIGDRTTQTTEQHEQKTSTGSSPETDDRGLLFKLLTKLLLLVWRIVSFLPRWSLAHLFPRKSPRYRTARVNKFPDSLEPLQIYVASDGQNVWGAAMLCPCGCGDTIELNLRRQVPPCWTVQEYPDGSISLMPAVRRQEGCRSRFYVRRGRIDEF